MSGAGGNRPYRGRKCLFIFRIHHNWFINELMYKCTSKLTIFYVKTTTSPIPNYRRGQHATIRFVRDLLALENESARTAAEMQKASVPRPGMDAAVRYIIALQEAAGIDIISDGEWRRAFLYRRDCRHRKRVRVEYARW